MTVTKERVASLAREWETLRIGIIGATNNPSSGLPQMSTREMDLARFLSEREDEIVAILKAYASGLWQQ